jgi:hypothetical protein
VAQYECVQNENIVPLSPVQFTAGQINNGIIGTAGAQFSSFVLQPGIYRITVTMTGWFNSEGPNPFAQITLTPLTIPLSPALVPTGPILSPSGVVVISGLAAVTVPNTVLQYVAAGQFSGVAPSCELDIQQLQ